MRAIADVSPEQVRCIKTLMGKAGIVGDPKESMVRGFSDMRTGSVSELRMSEARALIVHLKATSPKEQSAELMRRKLISMMYKYAGLPRNATKEDKRDAVKRLDAWCRKFSYKTKKLDSYTQQELPKLVSQFEIVDRKLLGEI